MKVQKLSSQFLSGAAKESNLEILPGKTFLLFFV